LSSNEPRDFAAADPDSLVRTLAAVGLDVPSGLVAAILDRGDKMVEPLGRLLLNASCWDTRGARDPLVWGPVHALHLLGGLGTVRVISPVLALLRADPGSSLLTDAVPAILSRFGGAAVEALIALIRDKSVEVVLRACTATEALLGIGQNKPEFRPRIVREILHWLDSPDTSANFKSWIALTAASVDDARIEKAIRTCFENGRILTEIIDYGVVRDIRANRFAGSPWAGLVARHDPLAHFDVENLAALALWWIDRVDLPKAQLRLWQSAPVLESARIAERERRAAQALLAASKETVPVVVAPDRVARRPPPRRDRPDEKRSTRLVRLRRYIRHRDTKLDTRRSWRRW